MLTPAVAAVQFCAMHSASLPLHKQMLMRRFLLVTLALLATACHRRPVDLRPESYALEVLSSDFQFLAGPPREPFRGVVRYRFTNNSRNHVGVPTCHGVWGPVLQAFADTQWVTFTHVWLTCGHPPLVIGPGETRLDSVWVDGCSERCLVKWPVEALTPMMRLEWTIYPVPRRIRNSYELPFFDPNQPVLVYSAPFRPSWRRIG